MGGRAVSKACRVIFAFVAASALALLSVFVERRGPEMLPYGNLCGPTSSEPCYEPVLKGGVPFAFLFDFPGVSVQHQLALVEDSFQLAAFVLDIAFYFAAILSVAWLAPRRLKFAGSATKERS